MDGFLKHKPMRHVGRGYLKPSCQTEVDASPIPGPASGEVERAGEERRSLTAESPAVGKPSASGADSIACLCSS